MAGVEQVNLIEVNITVGKLLLGFVVRLVNPGICGIVTELVPIQFPLVGLRVLVKTVRVGTVPVLTELGASVMLLVG